MRCLPLVLLAATAATPVSGAVQAPCNVQAVQPASPQPDDRFGSAVAGDGGTWVVGAPGRLDTGQAFVHEVGVGGVQQTALLWPSDLAALDGFGTAVAVDGDVIAVGCPGDDDGVFGAGSVYVFERFLGVWVQTAKLQASAPAAAASFGSAVDVSGDWLAVGAPFDAGASSFGGRVVLFENSGGTWVHRQDLVGPATLGRLGTAVDLDGGRLAIGAPGEAAGRVHVAERFGSVWVETAVLAPTGASPAAELGSDVALEGDRLLAGARSDATAAPGAGAAYVFGQVAGAWVQLQRLEVASPSAGDRFGDRVDLDGGRALVGAPGEDGSAPNAGCVHAFGPTGQTTTGGFPVLTEQAAFGSLGARSGASFGAALALDGPFLWAGAPGEDAPDADAGRVHGFSFEVAVCSPLVVGPLEVSAAAPGTLELALQVDPILAGQPYFLLGSSAGTSPGLAVGGMALPLNLPDGGYGDLLLASAGLAGRAATVGWLDATGAGTATIDLATLGATLVPGTTLDHAFFVFQGGLALYVSPPASVQVLP